jgi:hypothetical protein
VTTDLFKELDAIAIDSQLAAGVCTVSARRSRFCRLCSSQGEGCFCLVRFQRGPSDGYARFGKHNRPPGGVERGIQHHGACRGEFRVELYSRRKGHGVAGTESLSDAGCDKTIGAGSRANAIPVDLSAIELKSEVAGQGITSKMGRVRSQETLSEGTRAQGPVADAIRIHSCDTARWCLRASRHSGISASVDCGGQVAGGESRFIRFAISVFPGARSTG